MKKSLILVFLIAVVLISVIHVSAKYLCSDGSNISRSMKEMKELERKSINDIGIALLNAQEFSALRGIAAEIIIDAKKMVLSNSSPPETINISGSLHTISLINVTDTTAKINLDSSSYNLNKGEGNSTSNTEIVLAKSYFSDSGPTAEIIIGSKKISMSTTTSLKEIVVINGKEYLIELVSASGTDAIIAISKCNTGNLTEEKETIESNLSNNAVANASSKINETSNETSGKINQSENNKTLENNSVEEKEKPGFLRRIIDWILKLFKKG